MGRILLVLTVVLVAFVAVYRERIYLRDPLGSVTRAGEKVPDTRVFINYGNDVLVQEAGGSQMWAVQHWNGLQTVPAGLTCVQGIMCLAPAERLTGEAGSVLSSHEAVMTPREVNFVDGEGRPVQVALR